MRGETPSWSCLFSPKGHFNPLAPCGARQAISAQLVLDGLFQSTRPVRGETPGVKIRRLADLISIHSPRAGRDRVQGKDVRMNAISIHSPRAGRDNDFGRYIFQTRISIHSPRAGRDRSLRSLRKAGMISIHSPRAGRDIATFKYFKSPLNFNPLAPCGARQQKCTSYITLVCTLLIKKNNLNAVFPVCRISFALRQTGFFGAKQAVFFYCFRFAPTHIIKTSSAS